jgi:hypothetical protein
MNAAASAGLVVLSALAMIFAILSAMLRCLTPFVLLLEIR